MKKDNTRRNKEEKSREEKSTINRRDLIKSLATVPVLGAFAFAWFKKNKIDIRKSKSILQTLNLNSENDSPVVYSTKPDTKIKVGIIGCGIRGSQILQAAGYVDPELIDSWTGEKENEISQTRYRDYLQQDDLNVEITGICDVFDYRAEKAMAASANENKQGSDGTFGKQGRRYKNYYDMLKADDIDAVIIATPDHLHSAMAIEAAKQGKHVYLEKGMTRTVRETFDLRESIKKSGVIFQLGHQGRQTSGYNKAREVIQKQIIGKISLIEVCTNRNSPNGAWVYDIHPEASEKSIDWKKFIGPAPWHEFSLERFFRWRCWWDYGTGLAGDLLTHEYDALNQIMDLGIPHSAVASGGVYFYKDGREVPDVFQTVLEYPDRDLTFLYSASLASNRNRGKVIMGHDGHMEIGNSLTVYPDVQSTRYKKQIEEGIIDPFRPLYTYIPGRNNVDAVSSATADYFASRGLLYTYVGEKRVDTTHLHLKEWLQCIREGIQPSCNIDVGFEEAISAHMATIAYRENRKVFWDAKNEKIV